jgi:phospholipid transport system substrate-binding protein
MFVALFLLLAGARPAVAAGPGPTEQLKVAIDRVVAILQQPGLDPDDRRAQVRRSADEIFDWDEMARRALAQHWRALSPSQRAEFRAAFADLLERSYSGTLQRYQGEPIQFTGERVQDETASVFTRIVRKQGEVPVEYRMLRKGDRWVVYDVLVEGVGLVSNYRSQFHTILSTASFETLMARVRARIDELDAASRSGASERGR